MRQKKLFKTVFKNAVNAGSSVELDRFSAIDSSGSYRERKLKLLKMALADTVPPRKKYLIVTGITSKIYSEINGVFNNDSILIKKFIDEITILLNMHQVCDEIPVLFCYDTRVNLAARLREGYAQFANTELLGNLMSNEFKVTIKNAELVWIDMPKLGSIISCDSEASKDLILSQEIALKKLREKLNSYRVIISEHMQLIDYRDLMDSNGKDHVNELFSSLNGIFDWLKLALAGNILTYRQARLVVNRAAIVGERLINKSQLIRNIQSMDQAQHLQKNLCEYFIFSCNILASTFQFNEYSFSLEDSVLLQALDHIVEYIDTFYSSIWESCKIEFTDYYTAFIEMKKSFMCDLLECGSHQSVNFVKIGYFLQEYLHEVVEELDIRKHIHSLFSELRTRIFASADIEFRQEYIASFQLIDETISISTNYILVNSTNKIMCESLKCFLHLLCKKLAISIYEANSEKFTRIEDTIVIMIDEYVNELENDVEYVLNFASVNEGYNEKKCSMVNFLKRCHIAMINQQLISHTERLDHAIQAYHKRRTDYYRSPKNLLTTWAGDEHLLRCVIAEQQETYGKTFSEDASQNVRMMSVAPIRKLYRVLMLKYHPDKTNFLCEENTPLLQAINQNLNDFSAQIDRIDRGEYFASEECHSDVEPGPEIAPMVVYYDLTVLNEIIPSYMHSKIIEHFSLLLNCKFSKIPTDYSNQHIESIDFAIKKLSTQAKSIYDDVIKVEKSHVDDLKNQNQEMRDMIRVNDIKEQELDTIRISLLALKASQEKQTDNIQSVMDKISQNDVLLASLQRQLSELNDSLSAGQSCDLVRESSFKTNKNWPSFFQ